MRKNFRVPSKLIRKIETDRENKRLFYELSCIKPTMSVSLTRESSHMKFNRKKEQQKEGNQ